MEELSMKVKVRFAQPTILVKQEAYEAEQAEFERLFQENKDLRVSEAHLRDDLACAKAQIEAQRQAILHRDEQMLDQFEEIKALERMAIENEERKDEITELRDENCNLLLKLESAEKVIESLETQLTRTELHNTALESRLEEATAELVKHELNHYKDEAEEWKMTADKLSEAYRELLSKFTELQTEFNELNEDYDELAKAKREYAEEIDRLRNENKGLRNQMPLPEFMRQFIEMTREAVQNEFPDSGNS
jgi:chromosome segregation ATPase